MSDGPAQGSADRSPSMVILGEANLDVVVRGGDVVPRFGQEEQLVDAVDILLGGSGGITAAAAAMLSLRTTLVGIVGDDPAGRRIVEELERKGVDCQHVGIEQTLHTGCSAILTTSTDRAILTHLGTIAALETRHVDPTWLEGVDHVHVSSYFLQSGLHAGLGELLDEVRRSGSTISLDSNWDPAGTFDSGIAGLYDRLDILLVNESEADRLARAGGGRGGSAARCASELAQLIPLVVVKRGSLGALAEGRAGTVECPGRPAGVIDSIGAGDNFDAGFLAAWLRGFDVASSLSVGCATGSASTEAPGGTSRQLSWREALAQAGLHGGGDEQAGRSGDRRQANGKPPRRSR
ncbi:MAG: carbohydrate kinase family protein [Acidimicrobiales bacterium]